MEAPVIECPPEQTTDKKPDWALAQVLHSQAVPLKEICERCNVPFHGLQKRISQQGWSKRKEQAKAILSVRVEQTKNGQSVEVQANQPKSDELQNGSNLVRSCLSNELSGIATDVRAIKRPKSSQGILERLTLLKGLADVSKTVFGWSDTQTSLVVNISHLQAPAEWKTIDIDQASTAPTLTNTSPTPGSTVHPNQIVDVPSTVEPVPGQGGTVQGE